MRLFVAVAPPEEPLGHLREAVAAVRSGDAHSGTGGGATAATLGRSDFAAAGLRWAAPERWHLTLAFLGEVEEARLDPLRERLARAAGRYPPLHLAFAGAGRFDGRVLWVGLTGDTEALQRLAGSVAGAARHTGIAVEDRRYRPHLTLARTARPTDLRPLVAALEGYAGPLWVASEARLVRSFRGPRPRHEPLGAFPLRGAVGRAAAAGAERGGAGGEGTGGAGGVRGPPASP